MDNNIVTYSRSASIDLSKICTSNCAYCVYPENVLNQTQYELLVPYSTIKVCNQVKKFGVKEITFVSGDRPDNFSAVRARLDLWGFSSYVEYVYTVCELVFLEGFIPSIDIGYISQDEMAIIRRMTAAVKIMLDTVDDKLLTKYAPRRTLKSRLEVMRFAGEGKVPVTTGILVGLGESEESRKQALEMIKKLHEKYGHIQNVIIQDFKPALAPDNFDSSNVLGKREYNNTVLMAREILPEDVQITVPGVDHLEDIAALVSKGVRDIGSFDVFTEEKIGQTHPLMLKKIEKDLAKNGYGLQRRLPIFSKYIAGNWYSRKLAQILDRYKSLLQGVEAPADKVSDDLEDDSSVKTVKKPKEKIKKPAGKKVKK